MNREFVTTTVTRQPAANAADIDERLTRISESIANAVKEIYEERPVASHFKLPGDQPPTVKTNAVTSGFKLPEADDDSGGSPAASGFKLPS